MNLVKLLLKYCELDIEFDGKGFRLFAKGPVAIGVLIIIFITLFHRFI